ncbi:SSU ribosomal protein S6P modification protein [Fontimonas thermophila]|uniref:Probable alpha-L-glutamate ligase n=1 Tax=Fontimonas thermophila TaxID=1076937 RepID=A0A1I2JUN2_9GAMM|nr:30S ribosomal protein S6--L-glutamate ligase [Fontimonas thermophila]SFF57889.1 SSU ribosomal protein S6P modification protein [Fontimonas thermophila]
MKIAILSRNRRLYSTRRLVEAAEARGHSVRVVDVLRCYMNIRPGHPEIWYRGRRLEGFDAVIPRIGASVTFYGAAVVRQFEMMGVYCVNESLAITRARDKLRALQLLARRNIGMPATGFAHSPDDTAGVMRLVGGAPMVIKLIEGTQGQGVVLAETDAAASSVIEAFRGLEAYFLVQEFVAEAAGADIRCFVVGDKVVAAMRRVARPGEFRANLHRGASAEPVRISEQERRTALRAARAIGLNIAGVDMLRTARGPMVLEVNASPGLEGIEAASGVDVADRIIAFVERHARPRRAPARGGRG